MSAEYSVEEVRSVVSDMQATELSVIRAAKGKAAQMLTAYAERIKADEGAVPVATAVVRDDHGMPYIERMDHSLPVGTHKLFTHPPAQAAQVDAAEQAIGWFHGEFSDLNPATACLVWNFALALGNKLADAEKKYGYTDGWRSPDWMDECRTKLMEHIHKGDPRDVAAYCAFLWHHRESTATAAEPVAQSEAVQQEEYGGPDFEERCETLAKIERDMRIYLDEGMLLTPYTLELLCNRIKNVRDAGHDNVVMSLYNFRTLRRLAAQPRGKE